MGSPAPFAFRKTAFLVEVTPHRARSLGDLLTGVTLASEWALFYHLHQRFFRDPGGLPEYPNDFAAWVAGELGEYHVAERLANLNLFRSADLEAVRREISVILAQHLAHAEPGRCVAPERAFIFCQPRLVVFPSRRRARSPAEFLSILRETDPDTVGYHLFVPKLRGGAAANDFSAWFRECGHGSLADQLDAFDPYLNSLEDNRAYLLELIEIGLHQPHESDERA